MGLPLCDALTVVFHGRRDLGTIQTYVAHGGRGAGAAGRAGRAAARAVRPRPRRRRGPRGGRARCTPSRPPRCATRSSAPTPCSTSGASRSRTSRRPHVEVDRRIALDVRLPAHRLLPAALVAPERQMVVTAVCGARPLAEGPPADGDRLRPAGRRARVSAARRPGALPGGLPRGRRRARARDGRAARPPGGVGAPLPGALGRGLPADRPDPCLRAVTTVRPCAAPASSSPPSGSRLRLPRHLAPARPRADGSGAERAECSSSSAPRRAATPTPSSRRLPACRREPPACRPPATAWRARATRRGRDPHLHAVDPAVPHARGPAGSSPGAPARACRSSSACACGATGRSPAATSSCCRCRLRSPPTAAAASESGFEPDLRDFAAGPGVGIPRDAAAPDSSPRPARGARGALDAQAADMPTRQDALRRRALGRYLMDGQWLFRLDTADQGVRQRFYRSTSTAGWSPVSVPNVWNVGDDSEASMAAASAGTARTSSCRQARPRSSGRALRVGQLPLARLPQRARDRPQHRRLHPVQRCA